jgi:hypothetical protein
MLVAAAMTSALTGACTAEISDSSEMTAEAEGEARVMNGDRLSGVSLSGINVNGAFLNGVRYIGMRINGVLISNVTLNGTVLSGQLPNGTVLSGTDFISARMTGTLTDGTEITLRIDDIVVSGDADILNYKITHLQAGGNTAPICGTNSDGTYVLGFPLAGRWDHTSGTATGGAHIDDATRFTIACRGAALAKCAEQGYKPFKTVQECNSSGNCQAVDGRALHQACVRMIRADYCGDGTSHTVVGTEIDIYDAFGVKTEDPTAVWDLEAEWTAGGAACVLHTRWISTDNGNVEDYMRDHCPERFTPPASGVECGRDSSTFFTDNGYSVPVEQRVVFRNKSEVHP